MKVFSQHRIKIFNASASSREAAFTMVEIALSIAIVAFAMVAIIGVLPTGFQVQRDNREETIINQDGTYLLEAIRNGAGLDELTNFVERIIITNQVNNRRQIYVGRRLGSDDFSSSDIPLNGQLIVSMLSLPAVHITENSGKPSLQFNGVSAMMRSISGAAAQRFQANDFRENAFTYLVTPIITPYVSLPVSTNRFAQNVMSNLYDVRLRFQWPVNEQQNGYQVGRREKVFRALVSGRLVQTNVPNAPSNLPLFYFEPSNYLPVMR